MGRRSTCTETKEVHIRRRIYGAESAVEIERRDGRLEVPALGEHDLEDIAGGDVFLGAADALEKLCLRGAGADGQLLSCTWRRGKPRLYIEWREGLPAGGEFALDLSNVAQRAVISGAGRFGRDVGRGDDMDLVAKVIEGEDAIEEHQDAVGDVEVIFGAGADIFELADDVVGAIADGSGCKGWQAFDLRGTMLVEQFLDDLKDTGGAGFDFGDANGLCGDFGGARLLTGDSGSTLNGDLVAARFKA